MGRTARETVRDWLPGTPLRRPAGPCVPAPGAASLSLFNRFSVTRSHFLCFLVFSPNENMNSGVWGVRHSWDCTWHLSLTSGPLGRVLNLCKAWFPHVENKDDNTGFWGSQAMTQVKLQAGRVRHAVTLEKY